MKALLCTRAGTPDDLTIGDLLDPVAGPGQAVVRVEAVALNSLVSRPCSRASAFHAISFGASPGR